MIEANSVSFTNEDGRLLENMVFMHLRRKTKEIFYFKERKECDFVVFTMGKLSGLYQVCWQLVQENLDRELDGMVEALEFFKINSGIIITHNQTDEFIRGGKKISVLPFYSWAVSSE